jgi:hypothetical protein
MSEDKGPLPPIDDEKMYVLVCRRLARARGGTTVGSLMIPIDGPNRVDGRLVAVGYKHVSPTKWIKSDLLGSFVMWWNKTQENPYLVGSEQNAPPPLAYHFWNYLREGADKSKELSVALSSLPSWAWDRLISSRGCKIAKNEKGWYTVEGHIRIAWDAVLRGREIGRAIRRFRVADRQYLPKFSNAALAILGAHTPETQHSAIAALMKTPNDHEPAPIEVLTRIRPGDLPLALMSRVEKDVSKNPRVLLAHAYGESGYSLRFQDLAEKHGVGKDREALGKLFSPAYPHLPPEMAVRIARGESPVQLSGGVLNKAEAHAWLNDYNRYPAVALWIVRNLLDKPGFLAPRSPLVARWMVDIDKRGGWGQLTKDRVIYGPMNEEMHYTFASKLDEIQDEDLVDGVRTGVQAAFEHAAHRLEAPMIDRLSRDHRVLNKSGWPLYNKVMRELNTPALLITEGKEMRHCVGSYVESVRRGQDVILAINVNGNRSTIELEKVPKGGRRPRIFQHRSISNGPPAKINEVLIEKWMQKVFAPEK